MVRAQVPALVLQEAEQRAPYRARVQAPASAWATGCSAAPAQVMDSATVLEQARGQVQVQVQVPVPVRG